MDVRRYNLPPLSRLRPFEAAARYESFSLAADELGMTQTAVSKQIAQLENELGTALFERRNRAVFLTDAGRRLGRVVSTALADVAAEVAHIRGQRRSGELVLHCQLCEAFYWLMPRLSRFHEQFPDVELRVLSALNPLTQSAEAFDVAIQTSSRASGSARLAFTAADEVFPVCAPSLVMDRQLPLSAADLFSFPLLSHSVIPQDWMEWQDWFEHVGVPVSAHRRIMAFDSYPVALQAAVAGQGVALGWRRTTEAMIAEGKLMRPCRELVARPNELSVYSSAGRDQHPDTDRLVEWLSCELAQ
ncbi:LysR family transcriptional regulator [Tateyamaria omphalii]|uniref:LysR substrate-binding domain-containing protein n=1 Tax=Tateyamaria omphalii TaxID=299262 RepID=UPI001C9A1005|nr:LysR substrate-binding domain-containing protein [Tateyamaria omphalii]MBY5931511.1 LysR family transcriptional regulator [Tateyamaria omphalii]